MTLDEKLKGIFDIEVKFCAVDRGAQSEIRRLRLGINLLIEALQKCREQRDEVLSYELPKNQSAELWDAELLEILEGE